MTISVLFPSVMKMECTAYIVISECRTISEVKQKIFETFWKTMTPYSAFGKHSNANHVILRDKNHLEITDMSLLKERIIECPNFEVVFQEYPRTRTDFTK
jgi:hypothetical protein